ncbi:hypothetical protein CCACVL1_15120, partial [Corchorus capsularis]
MAVIGRKIKDAEPIPFSFERKGMVSEDVWLVSFQFYNDPVSGYVFRMKDALHYVETGEPGRLAFKPKDKSDNDEDLEEDNDCEPAIVERQKVAVNGTTDETERQSAEQVSNLSRITKGEEMLTSASTGEQTSFSFSRLWVCKAEAVDHRLTEEERVQLSLRSLGRLKPAMK